MPDFLFTIAFVLILTNFGRSLILRLVARETIGQSWLTVAGFGVGAAAFQLAVFILGATQKLSAPYLYAIVIIFALVPFRQWCDFVRSLAWQVKAIGKSGPHRLFMLGLLSSGMISLLFALSPPYAKDALVYHLAVPKLFLQHGGFRFISGNIYANFPMGVEMLYLPGMALGLDRVPALIHTVFSLLTSLALYLICKRLTKDYIAASLALVFAWTPSVLVAAGWPYVDLAITYCLVVSLGLLAFHMQKPASGLVFVLGIMAGYAFCVKYTGGIVVLFIGLVLLINALKTKASGTGKLKEVALFGLLASLIALPWVLKNLVLTGNPVYPFLFGIFGGREWDVFRAEVFSIFLADMGWGRSLTDLLLLPLNLAFRAGWEKPQFDGQIGIFYLALSPLFIYGLLKTRRAELFRQAVILFLLVYGAFWFISTQQIRFLLPICAVFLIACAGVMAQKQSTSRRLAALSWLFLPIMAFSAFLYTYSYYRWVNPLPVVLGQETRQEFINRMLPFNPLLDYINEKLPPDAKILLLFAGNRGYYLEREYYSDSFVQEIYLSSQVAQGAGPKQIRNRLRADGFSHVMVNAHILDQAQGGQLKPLIAGFFDSYCQVLLEKKPFVLLEIRSD